ncbi:hypothetical protein IFM89_037371 [Coptis chinensis]|uniref:C2 domain-containing protein n=1 Tax=Coptis chinensis TaxID=261450 RepID=A0A835M8D9_9MAGN|nr:hypothetical protein IFM89_037371 [Coptis chinensis]
MEKSSSRLLEIKIISAEDLRIDSRSTKKNAFVTIRTAANKLISTSMDSEGGSYPSWHENFELPLPHNVNHISLDVKCMNGSTVRTIGSASIPCSDFLEDWVPPNCLHFLSYRLRDSDGKRNGIVNLCIRLINPNYRPPILASTEVQAQGYKISNACKSTTRSCAQTGYSNTGGIAIGMPVTKGYVI